MAEDSIRLTDLEVHYRVGVPDAERAHPQRLLVSVELRRDLGPAAAGDDLRLTTDYAALAGRLLALGEGREWRLIETVAVEIAGLVLGEFGAESVRVEVKKYILPRAREVSVVVERSR